MKIKDLNKPVDNSSLIFFRIVFGLLIFLESAGAIFTGWVKRVFIDPEFTFTFIGFEWLTPLPGNGMYYYYALMAIFGFMVMVGLLYRFSLTAFTILWSATYLMQKTSYNNHYYLLILFCFIMLLLPAHRYYSVDAKHNPRIRSLTCPRWCYFLIILQLGIVYTFAAVAKIYPDWLAGMPIKLWFSVKADYPVIGDLLQEHWFIMAVAYGGILFDLLIVPLMLWKKTRLVGFFISVFFHLFNSIIFQIGIFPYLMLAALVFFFDPEEVRRLFFKRKSVLDSEEISNDKWEFNALKNISFKTVLVIYIIIQLWLPIRHYFYPGNVFWTEEGHRMAWRMMLRSKYGTVYYELKIPEAGISKIINPSEYLSPKQNSKIGSSPDLIWQFSQYLKREYEQQGYKNIEIYAQSKVSLNGGPYFPLIDPTVNLANVEWEPFQHSSWVTLEPGECE